MQSSCTVFGPHAWALLDADLTQTGQKLRLQVPDTAIISAGVLQKWIHTNSKTQAVQSVPRSQLSTSALLEKLKSQHPAYDPRNPDGWIAVAHMSDGLSWLLDALGLEQMLSKVFVGAVPEGAMISSSTDSSTAGQHMSELVMLQAYITPARDERFVTTFGGVEGSTTTTHVRCYSQRYRGPPSPESATAAALAAVQQAQEAAAYSGPGTLVSHPAAAEAEAEAGSRAGVAAGVSAADIQSSCTAADTCTDEIHRQSAVVATAELQLLQADAGSGASMRAGVLGPSDPNQGFDSPMGLSNVGSQHQLDGCGSQVVAAPLQVARAAGAAVQAVISYLDKALGLRVQGLVAEFIKRDSPHPEQQQLVLTGLLHLSMDPRQTVGGATTFTERWGQFLSASGPPPAPAPSSHSSFCRTAPHVCSEPTPAQVATTSRGAAAHGSCPTPQHQANYSARSPSPSRHGMLQANPNAGTLRSSANEPHSPTRRQLLSRTINQQFFPMLLGREAAAAGSPESPEPPSITKAHGRPSSAPRAAARPASPLPSRPASASCGNPKGEGAAGGYGRQAAESIRPRSASLTRPGAGGNPVLLASAGESCKLWLQTPLKAGDSLTAQLAAQVETCKERMQSLTEVAEVASHAARCATAQAVQQVAAVQQELLHLREDAAAALHERRHHQQQISTLQLERAEQSKVVQGLQQQVSSLQEQLNQDRSTLATMLRQHQDREQQLLEELSTSQQCAAELRASCSQLSARFEEEAEVVAALRVQLLDYKLQMGQMQMQAKKGRVLNTTTTNSSSIFRRPGSATPPAPLRPGSASGGSHAGVQGAAAAAVMEGMWSAGAVGQSSLLIRSGSSLPPHFLGPSHTAVGLQQDTPVGGQGTRPDLMQRHQHLTRSQPPPPTRQMPLESAQLGTAQRPSLAPTGKQAGECEAPAAAAAAAALPKTSQNTAGFTPGAPAASTACADVSLQSSDSTGQAASGTTGTATVDNTCKVGAGAQNLYGLPHHAQAPTQKRLSLLSHAPGLYSSTGDAHGRLPSQTTQATASATAVRSPPDHTARQTPNYVGGPDTTAGSKQRVSKASSARNDPDAMVADMVSSIKADLGSSLAGTSPEEPLLLIGDLMVGSSGFLTPSAPQQMAVILGLMQGLHGDLMEIYGYYAVLGGSQVVAGRLVLDLPQFGKLAYDLHLSQDNVTLSAIEDIFYLLSDRQACQALAATATTPSDITSSSSASNRKSHWTGHGASNVPSNSDGYGSVQQPDSSSTCTAKAATSQAAVVLPLDVLIPEQFAEALVRLACVRYRYGVCNWEYDWDESESSDEESSTARDATISPRSARLRQQQNAHSRRGPKVLQPEGAALLQQCSSWAHQIKGRSGSPCRPVAEEYQQPVETDDLATVVRIFVQHEVLKHARRSRLAGSTLGIRRAKDKALNMQGWNTLPVGSCLT